MIGVNTTNISGNVTGRIVFQSTKVKQIPACSFSIVSTRKGPRGGTVSACVKINAYGEGLVKLCETSLKKGTYVYVQGELMNRPGHHGELTEVRANQIIFNPVQEASVIETQDREESDEDYPEDQARMIRSNGFNTNGR